MFREVVVAHPGMTVLAHARRAFRRSLLAEYALVVAILCVAAVLTSFYSSEA